ncbi:UDP-N-acetylmuramoyl-L-alanine--D-glutamate ligase [Actinocatenispora sera]|uniref:UDP-N-acetylmuramoyl-L-alanine--D-glutamate ligase n=1 Tax=Actinocatenispora sera TaxID=390989 RepID=UPI0033CF2AD5
MTGYEGRRVLVAGAGVSGKACARALVDAGAVVTVLDRSASAGLAELAAAGIDTQVAPEPPTALLAGASDLVVSPVFAPHHPLVVAALAAGLDVYCEPELAWRLRPAGAADWLALTGTNGKTTAVTMLASILSAAGLSARAVGNIGDPLIDAVRANDCQVLAVELSSYQLHWSQRLAPLAGAYLNLADDHLDWHGDRDAYASAKTAVWRGAAAGGTAIGNADDPAVAALLSAVPGRQVSFTLGEPAPGQLGVVDGMLVDHAFGRGESTGAAFGTEPVELVAADQVRPAGAHNVANALAAAALARAYGVGPEAVAAGLAGYVPQPHRNQRVAQVAGVTYVDDSKATNPHAALASLLSYPRLVWIAGGQLKGVDPDELVSRVADRLAGAVLLGADRAQITAALRRHAPAIPVIEVSRSDDGAMADVVAAAARLAGPGDTVLLAPAAASYDMFDSYAQRGDRFAAAVAALPVA